VETKKKKRVVGSENQRRRLMTATRAKKGKLKMELSTGKYTEVKYNSTWSLEVFLSGNTRLCFQITFLLSICNSVMH